MKNKEKYAEKIIELSLRQEKLAVNKLTGELTSCDELECMNCEAQDGEHDCNLVEWGEREYEECKEPPVDWESVKIDTPILVSDHEEGKWLKRHFAGVFNGKVHAFEEGRTSYTNDVIKPPLPWKFAKLAKVED